MPRPFGGGGCAYLVADGEQCGAPRQLGSSYCPSHHALCYLASGSRAERQRLRYIAALGDKVGGTVPRGKLSDRFLRRLGGLRP